MVPSVIRTVVPYMVGAVIAWLLRLTGIDLTEFSEPMTQALITLLAGLYYVLVRYLERNQSEKFGWLLGFANQPVYPGEVGMVEPVAATPKTVVSGDEFSTL